MIGKFQKSRNVLKDSKMQKILDLIAICLFVAIASGITFGFIWFTILLEKIDGIIKKGIKK